MLYHDIVLQSDWQWADLADIARMALVLLIASIPVAMPTVITVTNSLGAQALAKKQAIFSRLEAIEELAGVDILCSDKTGTLTKNILTLAISRIIAETLESLDMKFPDPTVDIEEIKQKYHAIARQ